MPPILSHDGQDIQPEATDFLTPDEKSKLYNMWNEGLDSVLQKTINHLLGSYLLGGTLLSHEEYAERNGMAKGIREFGLTLQGQVESFIEELDNG